MSTTPCGSCTNRYDYDEYGSCPFCRQKDKVREMHKELEDLRAENIKLKCQIRNLCAKRTRRNA